MKNIVRKTLVFIFWVCFYMCFIPSANADSSLVDSGKWGDLSWTLDNDGLLIISGSGAMNDINWASTSAWRNYTGSINSVVIMSGVTNIGDYAFLNCNKLKSVTIPSSVTAIGEKAFTSCTSLTNITIPPSVTRIGESAFSGCKGLVSVTISEGVSVIADWAFDGCVELTSMTIPSSVVSISARAFESCSSLINIFVNRANQVYCDQDGVLFYKTMTYIVCFPEGRTGAYEIPSSVTSIGNFSFQFCSGLTSITIPSSVTYIGNCSFYECTGLTSVTIPSGVTSISASAFAYCRNLTSITVPSSVTSIDGLAFAYCRGLENVTISASVTSIGNSAFYQCSSIADVYYHGTQSEWNAISIESGNNPLTNATIHFEIPSGTWGNLHWILDNDGLLTIYGSGEMDDFNDNSNPAWRSHRIGIKAVVIEFGVTRISDCAFRDCKVLKSVTIPSSVTSIGNSAFRGCRGLLNIAIPTSVTYIGNSAFLYCDALTSMTIPSNVTNIGSSAFAYCSGLTSITIPVGVTSVDDETFYNCSGLTSITIPAGVTSIGDKAFMNCSGLISVTIPVGVTSIGSSAFGNCSGLTSVTIPVGVTSIGSSAFGSCSGLTSVTIPVGVTSIGTMTFAYCRGLANVTIPVSVTSIGYDAFMVCDHITDVYYHGSESEWNAISIDASNKDLINATIHYTPIFDVAKDAYSFGNSMSAFGYTSRGPGESYPIKYEPAFTLIFGNTVAGKTKHRIMIQSPWNGNCCGMASSAALLFADNSISALSFGKNNVYALSIGNSNGEVSVLTFIEAMQAAQKTDQFTSVEKANRVHKYELDAGSDKLNGLCTAVNNAAEQGKGTVIAIWRTIDGRLCGGHALLAYKIETISASEERMYVYDCNHPGESKYITLEMDSQDRISGWSYDMGGYGIWGSKDSGGYSYIISYVPYDTIEYIWDNRGHLYDNKDMLSYSGENLSIVDFSGTEVATIANGQLQTTRNDIYEVAELSLTENQTKSIFLPKDLYTVISNDGATLELSMVDGNVGASVTTTAASVTFGVDESTHENSVIVENATQNDTYSVSLESTFAGVKYENVVVRGTGRGENISISGNNDTLSISNCNVDSLQINGVERVTYTIRAYSGAGGTISPKGDVLVNVNGSKVFRIKPDDGYVVESVKIDGIDMGAITEYEFQNVVLDHSIAAYFKRAYGVTEAYFDRSSNTVSADIINQANAKLVCAIYNNEGQMLRISTKNLPKDSETVFITIPGGALPANITVKLFILDSRWRPLCASYSFTE